MTDPIPNPALLSNASPVAAPQRSRGEVTPPVAPAGRAGASFADVLADQTAAGAPSFSKHALQRLARRGVQMDQGTLTRLHDGLQRAADKGSRNSVVFVDGTAYVASVQNNTVITAVTSEAMNSHVFTNIDSAVIA